jgi:hypothetical protein
MDGSCGDEIGGNFLEKMKVSVMFVDSINITKTDHSSSQQQIIVPSLPINSKKLTSWWASSPLQPFVS